MLSRIIKGVFALFFVCLLVWLPAVPAPAADAPFDGPANWGGTGLMEIPNARVMQEGRFRIGASQMDPYRYYYFAISPLKGLEIGGKVTEALGFKASPGNATWQNYGNNKDKSIDLKYRIVPEGKWWPALAIGIMDPHGTRIYPAQYLVASKQIYPFDFTVGFGNGRFGKKPLPSQGEGIRIEMFSDTASWLKDGQFFGGVQFAVTDELFLMAEYNPIRYHEQTGDMAYKYFTSPVPSKFNFGIRWRPWKWLEADLSWQRGNQYGVNLSTAFDIGVPMVPLYDRPYWEKPEYRLSPAEERITQGLAASGFSNIIVRKDGDCLFLQARNDKYYYTPRALSVMLRLVDQMASPDIREVRLTLAENGIPITSFSTTRQDAALLFAEKLNVGEFLGLKRGSALFDLDITRGMSGKKYHRQWWDYGIEPSFRMFLNDPTGFFKYRLGGRGWVSLYPWTGGAFVTGVEYYPLNDVSTSNVPLSRAVRSDIVPYEQNKAVLGILMLEQIKKFPRQVYGRLAAGMLEMQYGGIDAEVAKPFFGGRLILGLSGSVVKKRDPDSALGFKKNDDRDYYDSGFLNTRLNIPALDGAIDLKIGQFLAGDRGVRITLSKFFNGVVLSAWYSVTNTDIFSDSFNRGYNDKGIGVSIPLRLFDGSDSRTSYPFALSPWTRDVAQDIDHFTPLFDYIGRNTEIYLKKDATSRGRNAGMQ